MRAKFCYTLAVRGIISWIELLYVEISRLFDIYIMYRLINTRAAKLQFIHIYRTNLVPSKNL